jgi:uncharacterized protein with ParB-like and HNH nuclease domain
MMISDDSDIDEHIDDFSEEENVQEDVVYSVNSFGADFLVDGLIRRLKDDDIYRPAFQRQFVWTVPQASRFIESILLGLPIPGIFLYREELTRKHLIIDGLQRLTTIAAFASGRFPGKDKIFRLSGLESRFNELSIDDLEQADKRRFFDTGIHATVIQQLSPENDFSSAYYIFERLNTGGTPLQPEEIRAALYHGLFQDFIINLNTDPLWRKVFGLEHKRAKDQELILRFFAFRYGRASYKAPMKSFLNKFMGTNRNLNKYPAERLRSDFIDALTFITQAVGEKPFRPERSLNAAAFDAVMVVVSENIDNLRGQTASFKDKYNSLMSDNDFRRLVTRSTAHEQGVKERFSLAERYLRA